MPDSPILYELASISDAAGHPVIGPVRLEWAQPGDCCTLIGETGSGKSLVAQSILGLLPQGFAAQGVLRIGTDAIPLHDRAALRAHWARTLSLVPQEPGTALDPTMRLHRQLRHVRGATEPAIRQSLDALDLKGADELFPFQMSGGMAQRALFTTALLGNAALIVADEPTKGLDERRAAQSLDALMRLRADGRRLLVITHDLDLARRLGGQVQVLRAGQVIESAGAKTLFAAPDHPYTRDLLEADPRHWPRRPGMLPAAPVVAELRDLSFAYGQKPVLENLSLRVHAGEVVALTGDSGTGKTTLGNVLLGLHRPRRGAVLWNGTDIATDRLALARLRRRFQKLHQDPAAVFARHRSIARHFHDLADFIPPTKLRERVQELLDRMRLRRALLERSVAEVSGGEAQRLALARILLLDPLLIVADEPSSRLDPIIQREIFDLLESVRAERSTAIVLISHHRGLVQSVAHRSLRLGPVLAR